MTGIKYGSQLMLLLAGLVYQVQSYAQIFSIDSLKIEVRREVLEQYAPEEIVELEYMNDNGRFGDDHKIWIWKSDSIEHIIILKGLESTIRIDTISSHDFIDHYITNDLKLYDHHLPSNVSHDFGYYIKIKLEGIQKSGYVRDIRRGVDNFRFYSQEELSKIEENMSPFVDWLNSIDHFYRKMTTED